MSNDTGAVRRFGSSELRAVDPNAPKIRLLVADDIRATRTSLVNFLRLETDIEVVGFAESGAEAIVLARRDTPHVLIMDINMPDMDGLTAAEQIKADPTLRNMAVIIMSLHNEPEYIQRAYIAGARHYLVKPFTGDELVSSVRKVAGRNVSS